MRDIAALLISILALVISGTTAWMTLVRRGKVSMTQPTVIFFGPDGGDGMPKVFLRTLLYCNAKTGRVVENMFVQVRRGESRQNFNVWVYGDGPIVRGSGLFVGDQGIATNHHFLPPQDGTTFQFLVGTYALDVFIVYSGSDAPQLLLTIGLEVSESIADRLKDGKSGVYFDWGPDAKSYHAHVDEMPRSKRTEDPREALLFLPSGPGGILLPR